MRKKMPILGIIFIFTLAGCGTNLSETVDTTKPVTETAPTQELPEKEPVEQEDTQPPLEETGTLEVKFIHRDSLQSVWAEYRIYPAGEWERIIAWDSGSECIEYLQGGVYDLYYAWEDGDGWIRDISLTPGSLVAKVVALPDE